MGWFSKTFYGVDLDEEQARQDDLDRKLAIENRRDHDTGVFTDAVYEEAEANRQASYISDVNSEVHQAFNTELNSRVASVRDFAGDAVGAVAKSTLGLIPPIVWIAAAVFLAWKFGLLNGLLKKARG